MKNYKTTKKIQLAKQVSAKMLTSIHMRLVHHWHLNILHDSIYQYISIILPMKFLIYVLKYVANVQPSGRRQTYHYCFYIYEAGQQNSSRNTLTICNTDLFSYFIACNLQSMKFVEIENRYNLNVMSQQDFNIIQAYVNNSRLVKLLILGNTH